MIMKQKTKERLLGLAILAFDLAFIVIMTVK